MDRQQSERTPRKCFRCGSIDNLIAKCPKPHKDNKKQLKTVCFNERGICASQKKSKNVDYGNYQKIYAYIARMSGNERSPSRNFGGSSQLTNWILDSGETYHMTLQVSKIYPSFIIIYG